MKTIRITTLFLMFIFLCCTRFNVSTNPDTTFFHNCTIAIVCNGHDPLGIQRELEDLLLSKGFNVATERLARIKIIMQERNNNVSLAENEAKEFSKRVKESPSVYILRFNYDFHHLTVYQYYIFTTFKATITDLSTGEIVTTADFSQSRFGRRSISNTLKKIVTKLSDASRYKSH